MPPPLSKNLIIISFSFLYISIKIYFLPSFKVNISIELFIKGNVSAKPAETLPEKNQSPVEQKNNQPF